MTFSLTAYKLLSFDIYATLIDWESGIYQALQRLISRVPSTHAFHSASPADARRQILRAYSTHEQAIQRQQPKLIYTNVLALIYTRLAAELGVQAGESEPGEFAASIGSWPAYADTVAAMQVLGAHYKLVVLSNVDKASFARTLAGPLQGVKFDAIYTAEDIGSYKPDLRNFEYLIEGVGREFGVAKAEILHVAQSLTHDHVPAKEIGLEPGVFISRAGGEGRGSAMGGSLEGLEREGKVRLAAVYETLGEMAEAVEEAFARK